MNEQNIKQIQGFSGEYGITSDGKVWSFPRWERGSKEGKWMKTWLSGYGYEEVQLRKDKRYVRVKIHRLVAQHFVPNPYGYNSVNHINGDKLDNRAENLEWCTIAQNTAHAHRTGLYNEKYKIPPWNKGKTGFKYKKHK